MVVLAVAVGIIVAECSMLLYQNLHGMPLDLSVYRWGGQAIRHDGLLYQVPAVGNLLFTYPPFAAVLFAPLSMLPPILEQLIWTLGSIAAVVYICRTCLRLSGLPVTTLLLSTAVAASLVLEPVRHTFALGQINLFLLALVLWDMSLLARGRRAGVGIGLAAAVKLIPGLFIVLLLISRRFQSAATATATFLGCALVGALIAPAASAEYWRHEVFDTGRVGVTYISNQSVYAAASRLFGSPGNVGDWYVLLVGALGVLGLATATRFARRGEWLLAATACGTTALVVSPVSWTHHWVWAAPGLLILVQGTRRMRIAGAAGYLLFVVAPLWWTPRNGQPLEYGFHGPLTLVANCYLVAGTTFLFYLAWSVFSIKEDPIFWPEPVVRPAALPEPCRPL